jgi:hypothetical protein
MFHPNHFQYQHLANHQHNNLLKYTVNLAQLDNENYEHNFTFNN